jgi:hypothetical protein
MYDSAREGSSSERKTEKARGREGAREEGTGMFA